MKYSGAKYCVAACALALVSAAAFAGEITLYRQMGLNGTSMTTDEPVSDIERTSFFYVASSASVRSGTWEVCTKANFSGHCAQLVPGQYSELGAQLDGPIISAREVHYDKDYGHVVIAPDDRRYDHGRVVLAPDDREPIMIAGAPPRVVAPDPAPIVVVPESRVITYPQPVPSPAGPLIVLYQHTPSGIRAVQLASNVDDLGTRQFSDAADSALVSDGVWRLCDGLRGTGNCADYSPGQYASLQSFNGRVKSIYLASPTPSRVTTARVVPSGRATLYQYPNYGGPTAVVQYGRAPDLDWAHFTSPAASLRIDAGSWLLCSDMGYQGECRVLGPGEYPSLAGMFEQGVRSAREVWTPMYGTVTYPLR